MIPDRIVVDESGEGVADITAGFSLAHLKELVISVEVYGKDVNETIKLLSPKEKKKER